MSKPYVALKVNLPPVTTPIIAPPHDLRDVKTSSYAPLNLAKTAPSAASALKGQAASSAASALTGKASVRAPPIAVKVSLGAIGAKMGVEPVKTDGKVATNVKMEGEGGFEGQPVRFSSRRYGKEGAQCVTAASAAEKLQPYVCMSAEPSDIEIATESHFVSLGADDQKSHNVSDILDHHRAFIDTIQSQRKAFYLGLVVFGITKYAHVAAFPPAVVLNKNVPEVAYLTFTFFLYSRAAFRIKDNAVLNRFTKAPITFCAQQSRYRALKIGTPGHVSVALWDTEKQLMEIFDSNGGSPSIRAKQIAALKYLFAVDHPSITYYIVNTTFTENDNFCQTYIYYYLYQRLVRNKTPEQIVQHLQSLPPDTRFNLISHFWTFINTPKTTQVAEIMKI